MKPFIRCILTSLLAVGTTAALAITDAPAPAPTTSPAGSPPAGPGTPSTSAGAAPAAQLSPAEQANLAFNIGLQLLKEADAAPQDQARMTYVRARRQFEEAIRLAPQMPQAWNGTGYAQRKLGYYDGALAAYDIALRLKPGYPEATEYRAEAHLALNRLEEAKQAYLDLFGSNRAIADQLLVAMKSWVTMRRASPAGLDGVTIDSFAKWVEERSQIAAQTASLTRGGTPAAW